MALTTTFTLDSDLGEVHVDISDDEVTFSMMREDNKGFTVARRDLAELTQHILPPLPPFTPMQEGVHDI